MVVSSSSTPLGSEFNEVPHVLVVDDSPVDRKIIEKIITNSVCKVTTAENGKKALEFLGLDLEDDQPSKNKDLKVDMIVTDYFMPEMTGYELLKKIKESPNLKEIPVVVTSSEDTPARIKQCLDEGAQDFLHKPLQPTDVAKLRCHIEKLKNPC